MIYKDKFWEFVREYAYQVTVRQNSVTVWCIRGAPLTELYVTMPDVAPRIKKLRGDMYVITFEKDGIFNDLVG